MAFKIQPSFTAGELAPSIYARVDLAKFHVGCRTLRNMIANAHGGVSSRPGTLFVGEVEDSTRRHRLVRFEFSTTQAYILVFGHLTMQVIMDRGFVIASGSTRVQIATPYTESDLPRLKFTQSADTLYIAHPSYAPRKLTRSSHTTWTLSTISFAPAVTAPTGVTATATGLTAGAWNLNYKVSAVTADGEEGEPSSAGATTYNGTWTAGGYVTVAWSAVSGASEYNVYKDVNGYYGWVGTVQGLSFKDNNITPSAANGPQQARNPFAAAGDYPSEVSLHEQRSLWACTNNKPATFWGSRTGDYSNMNVSSPLKDDDGYAYTLAAREVNPINGMCSLRELILFTGGAVWKATGAQDNAVITPKSINVKPQTLYGSEGLPPIIIGESVIYVQRGGRAVRDLFYTLEKDGYSGNDLTVLSNHLFRNCKAYEWGYAQNPYGIIWIVSDDGALLGCTYLREHDVVGWHRHDTDGTFESVAVVPGSQQDEVYFIVNRTVGGVTKRYVEMMPERIEGAELEKCFFVDSGLIYDGVSTSTLTGLSHLAGKTVSVFANGAVQPQCVVDPSGSITLSRACTYAVVGLPITSEFESLDIDLDDQEGSSVGRVKTLSKVIFMLEDTRGLWAGPNFTNMEEVKMRTEDMSGSPIPLYTGAKEMRFTGGYATAVRVCIRQTDPVPMTILAIVPEVYVSEKVREAYMPQRMELS